VLSSGAVLLLALGTNAFAQGPPNPTQQQVVITPETGVPVFRVTVVSRSTKAVNYRHRGGATKVDFRGTPLLPEARGEAKVESKQGYIEIEVEFDELQPATRYGPEYLTYVMWAITPEGRATNLGEVLLNGTESKLNVTTEMQSFGLIVTAEPYFAVSQPSDVVVMENFIRTDTVGKVDIVDAKYELLKRGQYTMNVSPSQITTRISDSKIPLELYEARNAVQLAQFAGADRFAGDTFSKARNQLALAEDHMIRRSGRRTIVMTAREAVQTAEDSRLIALQRAEEARLAQERQAAAERERVERQRAEDARVRADEEAARRRDADAARLAAERSRAESDAAAQRFAQQKAEAEAARAAADSARAAADAAKAAALAEQQRAQLDADAARRAAADAERERDELRSRLQKQLNLILETRESARGLIVNMSDVLFDIDQATLKPGAREKLAKVSGILLAYPGLKLEVEGHTDSTGSDEHNQRLSDRRAESVRSYLVSQGIQTASITARGFGESRPVVTNDTAAGRQQNRRVELVVSGEVIGVTITTSQR
jgi:outer membrane protein OmpA-like peptidoglycan-associated protein